MSSKKKESKPISAEASNVLLMLRKNKLLQNPKPQSNQPSPMDIQDDSHKDNNLNQEPLSKEQQKIQPQLNHLHMDSNSVMEAEELFENLIPQTPIDQRKQKSPIKPIPNKQSPSKQTPAKSATKYKKEKPVIEQEKIIQTKSILKKGKIAQEKPQKSQQQQSQESEQEKVESQEPKRRSVQFQGLLPLNTELEKRWKDPIENQRKGKFDKQEERVLSQAVGKILVVNDISLEELQHMLTEGERSEKISRKQKIFSILSTALPNRSPESCYKYLKRNFNSLNRQGKWSEQDVEKLKSLVERHGRKWTIISKELKRTADNCYDKFRSLGDQNLEQRTKGIWKFAQVVQLLKLIEKMTKIKFLQARVDKQLQRADAHDEQQRQEVMKRKYNSKNFIFHNIAVLKPYMNAKNFQKIDISKIRWNEIAMYLKTRNTLDCRNKIVTLLQIFFHAEAKQLDELIVQFFIKNKFQSQHEINWKDWKNKDVTSDQAKNRYMIMKKMIEGRSVMPFKEIVLELKKRVDKRNTQKSEQKKSKSKPKPVQLIEEQE